MNWLHEILRRLSQQPRRQPSKSKAEVEILKKESEKVMVEFRGALDKLERAVKKESNGTRH